jgi:hypothetical protein
MSAMQALVIERAILVLRQAQVLLGPCDQPTMPRLTQFSAQMHNTLSHQGVSRHGSNEENASHWPMNQNCHQRSQPLT